MQTVIIKIGSEALSRNGVPDKELLSDIVGQIAELKSQGYFVVLVTSGAKSSGESLLGFKHGMLAEFAEMKGVLASIGQPHLMGIYGELFAEHGLHTGQFLLTHDNIVKAGRERLTRKFRLLKESCPTVVPIVNANDAVTSEEIDLIEELTDNAKLAGLLAAMLDADHLIILSNVKGVYDRSPDQTDAQLIHEIDCSDPPLIDAEGSSPRGSGGMASKFEVALRLARQGICAHIASSRAENVIPRALRSEAGTIFWPSAKFPHTNLAAGGIGRREEEISLI